MEKRKEEPLAPSLSSALKRLPADQKIAGYKKLGDHNVGRVAFVSSYVIGQLTTMSAWISASLLAMNGAGLVYLVQDIVRLPSPVGPAVAFALGAGASLLSGYSIQIIQLKSMRPLEQLSLYWLGVSIVGEYNEADEARVGRALTMVNRLGWIPQALGGAAIALFVLGAFLFGSQLMSARNPVESPPRSERFDVRPAGGTTFFLLDQRSGQHFYCRDIGKCVAATWPAK